MASILKRWPGKAENPRWAVCRMAMGREPEAWEFVAWVSARWVQFMKGRPGFRSQYHAEFDEWLKANPNPQPRRPP